MPNTVDQVIGALVTDETDLMVDSINTIAVLLTRAARDARRDML